jgi:hypothetical protein
MKAFLFLRILVTIALLAVVIPWTLQAQNSGDNEALTSFAGTWRGTCQDGNPYVILSIES